MGRIEARPDELFAVDPDELDCSGVFGGSPPCSREVGEPVAKAGVIGAEAVTITPDRPVTN